MKQKFTLAALTIALFTAPALAAPTAQQEQLNEDCAIVANIALDSMGQFQAGKNQSTALKMLQQKYVKPAKPEAQQMVGRVVESINNMLYKQPKGAIEIGQNRCRTPRPYASMGSRGLHHLHQQWQITR